jgi:hypothetical protein
MLVYFYKIRPKTDPGFPAPPTGKAALNKEALAAWYKKAAFIALLALPMIIPSDWTQDVPARYSHRHAGISYSPIYPPIDIPGTDQISEGYQDSAAVSDEKRNDNE